MTNLPTNDFRLSTSDIIKATLSYVKNIGAVSTGIISSDRKDVLLSLGHLLQSSISGDLLNQLLTEWDRFKEKGKIKDDYEETNQHKSLLAELFKYLNQDIPNETIFRIMKQIFIVAATEKYSTRNDTEINTYIKIIKKLSPEAVLVLNGCYQSIGKIATLNTSLGVWSSEIAKASGIRFHEIVDLCRKELTDTKLLDETMLNTRGEAFFSNSQNGVGLTHLGRSLCEYITKYDEIIEK